MKRLLTGVSGLDEILYGGLIANRSYLLRGGPGAGKTTLGLHFLTKGTLQSEKALFITLGETAKQIKQNGENSGFNLSQVEFLDLSPDADFFTQTETYDIFAPAEVEKESLTQNIIECVEKLQPQRVFLDAMTQLRYLSQDSFAYHKQVLSFLRFLVGKNITVIFASEGSKSCPDDDLQFLSDGVINLSYSPDGRNISVTKFRGSDFRRGWHSMRLNREGIKVFPRLLPVSSKREFGTQKVSSGIPELDEMLKGGLERGTTTIITGPSGVGKTTTGLQFMKEAAGRGERSVVYTFEEGKDTLIQRSQAVNIPVGAMIEKGILAIKTIEPLYYSPDEFSYMVKREVENKDTSIVMIDSISGYRLSFTDEDVASHLHALCKYLKNMGVTVLLINEVEMITGDFRATEMGISYLSDNIIFLRFLEVKAEIRKMIGVLKKRLGDFEKRLREIEITKYGIKIGKPLTNLKGILQGAPELIEEENK